MRRKSREKGSQGGGTQWKRRREREGVKEKPQEGGGVAYMGDWAQEKGKDAISLSYPSAQ